jgi:radical SAM superfamily enzyme YgiQ (UPF0313 family)
MKKVGLISIFIGLESFNDFDLNKIYNKSAAVDDNEKCINFFQNNRINVF